MNAHLKPEAHGFRYKRSLASNAFYLSARATRLQNAWDFINRYDDSTCVTQKNTTQYKFVYQNKCQPSNPVPSTVIKVPPNAVPNAGDTFVIVGAKLGSKVTTSESSLAVPTATLSRTLEEDTVA